MNKYHERLQQTLDKTVDGKKVFGASFALQNERLTWQGASGNLALGRPYFIASTTKLFTTAAILQLRARGRLELEDTLGKYLDARTLRHLHVYKQQDYSHSLTLRHLLAHTSGLPDYFQGKAAGGTSLETELKTGKDQSWTFEQAVERSKGMAPLFAPGTRNKAHYSDTNFQLLGKIIEVITDKPYSHHCADAIIRPLGLADTYLYDNPSDRTPQPLYYQRQELPIFRAMASFGPDGGMVSTSADMLVFIQAFFSGRLFPAEYIQKLQAWNRIFFPMRSGVGLHQFRLPWYFDPFGRVPEFWGHSGLSGALAFYSPKHRLYIAGTVNQVAYPHVSFVTMVKLAQVMIHS